MNGDLISKSVLLKEIEDNYDCNYGETLIDPRHFYDLVNEQTVIHGDWILCSDKLPEPKEWCWIWFVGMKDVEDIETRIFGSEIQWKYWKNKKWNNIEL